MAINPLGSLTNISRQYGRIIPFEFAKEELYLVNDLGLIQHILRTNYTNYPRRKSLIDLLPLLGNGLFASEHEYWVSQRRTINSAFHSKVMEDFIPAIHSETEALISEWEKKRRINEAVEIQFEMKKLMLGIFINTMFSKQIEFDPTSIISSLDIVQKHASIVNHTGRLAYEKLAAPLNLPKLKSKVFWDNIRMLDDFVYGIINDCIKGEIEPSGLLAILLNEYEEGKTYKKQIRDEMMNFLFAGFDTVAQSLVWNWYLIAKHPDVEKNLHDEIDTVLGGRNPVMADIQQMCFTKNVFDETLRLYPAAWAFFRITTNDDYFNDILLPAKSYLMICPFALHRRPDLWDSPELFKPRRFENIRNYDPSMTGYIPFGDGPHICIGKKLAILEAQIIIGMIAQRFRLNLLSKKKIRIDPGIIMKSKDKIYFSLEKRS